MNKFLAISLLSTSILAAQPSPSVNEGIRAFKSARYAEAIQHFSAAVQQNPSDPTARLYLGTAYMSQYVPGADSPENNTWADRAEEQFKAVLALDSRHELALESLASLSYNRAQAPQALEQKLARFDQSAEWYNRLLAINPNNKEAHYSLGVITWARFYPEYMNARRQISMRPEDPGPLRDNNLRVDMRIRHGSALADGIRHLEEALRIDPEYDEAMAYLNLLWRERADFADTPGDYQREVQTADNFVQQALETKKRKAERHAGSQGSITFNPAPEGQLIDMKRHLRAALVAPPPPPPPPPPGTRPTAVAGIIDHAPNSFAAPPPPPPGYGQRSPEMPKQIRVGGNVQAAKLIEKPEPVYPPLAQQARIQGVVRYTAVVGRDGTVLNLTLVSGHPLLVPSATEAVRRYRYQTTLLNGEPVEVVTQVDVNFTLMP